MAMRTWAGGVPLGAQFKESAPLSARRAFDASRDAQKSDATNEEAGGLGPCVKSTTKGPPPREIFPVFRTPLGQTANGATG